MLNISGEVSGNGPRAKRRAAVLILAVAIVAAVATGSWAGAATLTPVKDRPKVVEGVPTSHGAWFGWQQNSQETPSHDNYFVQRGTQEPVRVNAAKTNGLGGGIVGHHVYYLQYYDTKHNSRRPRLMDLDLENGQRTPLPPKVNHGHVRAQLNGNKSRALSEVRGNATASGPWLLYSGYMDDLDQGGFYYTVMLYNRTTHRLRTVDAVDYLSDTNWAGQVNGTYLTYWHYQDYSTIYRYNIKTRETVELSLSDAASQWDPALSSDGTVYYVQRPDDVPAGGPYTYELIRQPMDGPAEVVRTFTTETRTLPLSETFVRDRANGSKVVFFSWKGDVYKLVDSPQ